MKCQLYNETQDIMEHNKIKSQNAETHCQLNTTGTQK